MPASELCHSLVSVAGSSLLVRPQTFMNRSGFAVECLVDLHEIPLERLLVVYDDVALPLGRLRLRPAGSPGGHRGVESIVHSLHSEVFARLRLGIGPPPEAPADLSEFVLAPFSGDESAVVGDLLERAVEAVEAWRETGIEAAMNRCNG